MHWRKTLLALSTGLILGSCGQNTIKQSDNSELNSTVVNGSAPTGHIRESGIVLLRLKAGNSFVRTKTKWCSATLLNNSWVLTAAHCVYGTDFELLSTDLEVVNGPSPISIDADGAPYQISDVKGIYLHPSVNGVRGSSIDYENKHTDIALLHLETPIKINGTSTKFKQPIYDGNEDSLNGKKVIVYGYGFDISVDPDDTATTRAENAKPAVLRQATLSVDGKKHVFYRVKRNDLGQMYTFGDSGGSSFLDGTAILTGVHSSICETPLIPRTWDEKHSCGYDVSAENFRDWALRTINTETEEENLELIELKGTKNLKNTVVATFSEPKSTTTTDLQNVWFSVKGSYLTSAATVRRAGSFNSEIHGQPRDLYEVVINDYDINTSKCAPFFGSFLCELNTSLFNATGSHSLKIKTFVLVSP